MNWRQDNHLNPGENIPNYCYLLLSLSLSLSAVLPLLGQPPVLFCINVGAPGQTAPGQQGRIHLERDAKLCSRECFLHNVLCAARSSSLSHVRACLHSKILPSTTTPGFVFAEQCPLPKLPTP